MMSRLYVRNLSDNLINAADQENKKNNLDLEQECNDKIFCFKQVIEMKMAVNVEAFGRSELEDAFHEWQMKKAHIGYINTKMIGVK